MPTGDKVLRVFGVSSRGIPQTREMSLTVPGCSSQPWRDRPLSGALQLVLKLLLAGGPGDARPQDRLLVLVAGAWRKSGLEI